GDKRLFGEVQIDLEDGLKPVDWHKVSVGWTEYATGHTRARGVVKSLIGHRNDPGVDILSIIHKHGISIGFPEEVMDQVSKAHDVVDS
ncbi:hypothetical protein OI75_02765, partial [Listeria monocytogenes]